MDLPLNSSPDLSMADITTKMFNSSFLSDIQFCIAGQVIYAHSFELMKRSVVFQNQLETTFRDKKFIAIADISYACYYQFIQFIYTDKCELNEQNVFDIYKLALKYKIPKLENMAMEFLNFDNNFTLRLFEVCVMEKIQVPLGRIIETIAHDLSTYLSCKEFLTLHPKALEQILNFERVNIPESQLFRAVIKWMDYQMDQNPVPLQQARVEFDKYLQLIRFSSMTVDDVLEGNSKTNNWLTEHDFSLFFKQIAEGCSSGQHNTNCRCRPEYSYPYCWLNMPKQHISPTTFTVSKELRFIGIRYGNDSPESNHLISLSRTDLKTNKKNRLVFKFPAFINEKGSRIFSFGHSLELKPNFEYTLITSYLDMKRKTDVLCREPKREIIIRAPRDTVNLLTAGMNIIEMHFKSDAQEDNLISL